MAYADLATIQDTDPGDILTAAWCDQVRDNEEFLIDPPSCSVFNSATQTLSSTSVTWTSLTCDSENFDNDSMHSTSSNTARITAQTTGRYQLTATLEYVANSTGFRGVRFFENGATIYLSQLLLPVTGAATRIQGTRNITLTAGEYVEVQGIQNSGGNLDVTVVEFAALFITR
jgi:hypothetical protein